MLLWSLLKFLAQALRKGMAVASITVHVPVGLLILQYLIRTK
jgi:hypothetical protein